jgi:putative DNA primase/helicase
MSTITRDASFEKQTFFTEKGRFEFDKFAHWLVNTYSIVKIDGRLHIYQDGVYVPDESIIESAMIGEIRKLSDAQRKEVLKYLNILVRENTKRSDARYIAFNNGIYDIFTDELLNFDPSFVITNKIPFDYNPNAKSDVVDKTLSKLACNDPEIRALLEEMVGYCMYSASDLHKSFILIGDKSNGKSTFLDMVTTMLGTENVSSLDMNELDETFKTAELFGKLANIGDDIGDEFIPNSAIFKKLVTGNRVNVQRKFANPFDFNNYAKLLFSANNLPRIKDKTGAVQRRLVIIPFHATFSKNDPDYDPFIRYKLVESHNIEYLIKRGIEGLKRVLENQAFSECAQVNKELRDYEAVNNPITVFLDELDEDDVVNESTRDVYSRYQQFCLADNLNPMGLGEFSKAIKKRFDVDIVDRRVDGKRLRIFVKS